MKKRTLALIITLSTILLLFLGAKVFLAVMTANLENLRTIPIEKLNLARLESGTYRGRAAQFPLEVEVEVEVLDNRIEDIRLLKHRNREGEQAESVLSMIIESQSLQVDAIGGATYSSLVILQAIEDALNSNN